ncbi:MAG: hypothetical protein QM784_35640 [Polyangiaceae bacterium]
MRSHHALSSGAVASNSVRGNMRTVGCLSVLSILSFAGSALAQAAVPPPTGYAPPPSAVPPPTGYAPPASAVPPPSGYNGAPSAAQPAQYGTAPTQPGVGTGAAPVPAAPANPAVTQPSNGTPGAGQAVPPAGQTTTAGQSAVAAESSATAGSQAELAFGTQSDPAAAAAPGGGDASGVDDETWNRENRTASLRFGNSLSGGVGLLHMQTAFSGSPGTFRTSFTSGYFSGSQFLCPSSGSCAVPTGASSTDEAESVTSDIAVSATLLSYLEAYAAIHSMATSNTLGRPQLLQVVGDTNFGLKAFSPAKPDRVLSFGGSMDLWLLNGSGMLGVDNANFTLRALAGVDLNQRRDPNRRVPVRFHAMLGYLFDGSGGLVEGVEKSRGQESNQSHRTLRTRHQPRRQLAAWNWRRVHAQDRPTLRRVDLRHPKQSARLQVRGRG